MIAPRPADRFVVDLQSRFDSADGNPVEFGKSNFGFLGVRVAKTMSEQFGGGRSDRRARIEGRAAIFGKSARWVDYSGPSGPGKVEGICVMDHPSNPHHPTPWHVRGDGWIGASFNRESSHGVARDHPLSLRYRLLVHSGPADAEVLNSAWEFYARTPAYTIDFPGKLGLAQLNRGESSG